MKTKRHTYDYEVDTSSESASANVVRLVGNGKRVLEVGCGPGSITKILFEQGNCQVTGLELDREAINLVRPFCEAIIEADLNSSNWPRLLDKFPKFDVVVAADVLEHLYDPWQAVKLMSSCINSNGYLVVSLPHIGHAAIASCLITSDFQYRNYGLLDRTHIRFFGLKNIEDLFRQAKLKITEVRYVRKLPEETELAENWSKIPYSLQEKLMEPAHSDIYQVVVKAVPVDFLGTPISLTPENRIYKRSIAIFLSSMKERAIQNMNPDLKYRIKNIFHLFGIRL